jgi:hypothetical protein
MAAVCMFVKLWLPPGVNGVQVFVHGQHIVALTRQPPYVAIPLQRRKHASPIHFNRLERSVIRLMKYCERDVSAQG